MDGVVLNLEGIRQKAGEKDNFLCLKWALDLREGSPQDLFGDHCGAYFHDGAWNIFTDHFGTHQVFHYIDKSSGRTFFCTDYLQLLKLLLVFDYRLRLSRDSAYALLTFGFTIGSETLVEGVHRLDAGSTLVVQNGSTRVKRYHHLDNSNFISDSKEKIIETLDGLFQKAIDLEYRKDLEYGYCHLATLSGGLDSRMNVFYAVKSGFSDIHCLNFSQSGYLDHTIAQRIASDLRLEFTHHSLDNGNYLIDIESPTRLNGGLVLYSNGAHVLNSMSSINWGNYGLLHTGQIGDFVMGSYLTGKGLNPVSIEIFKKIAYSKRLLDRLPASLLGECSAVHENDETLAFYERCVNGVYNGYVMIRPFTDHASPFLYPPFADYAFKIPPEMRRGEAIYKKWMAKRIPDTCNYMWEKTGVKVRTPEKFGLLYKGQRKLRMMAGSKIVNSMNPFDIWYSSNFALRDTFNNYFNDTYPLLESTYNGLQDDTKVMFLEGSFLEKTQALTLLSAVKIIRGLGTDLTG